MVSRSNFRLPLWCIVIALPLVVALSSLCWVYFSRRIEPQMTIQSNLVPGGFDGFSKNIRRYLTTEPDIISSVEKQIVANGDKVNEFHFVRQDGVDQVSFVISVSESTNHRIGNMIDPVDRSPTVVLKSKVSCPTREETGVRNNLREKLRDLHRVLRRAY
jgi:hypothetical protein